jgi:phenylacetic acid degradation operon negative regulatory protein
VRPRSLVVDLYGDYVRYRGGEIGLQELIKLMAPFGVSEQSARMTVSRLKKEDWLYARRVGRYSYYSLTPRAFRLLDEGRERIFTRSEDDWSGGWYMVIYKVSESERKMRERLRQILAWLGFGAFAPSTWVSVRDRFDELTKEMAEEGIEASIDMLTVRTAGIEQDRDFAARCWNLGAIDARYREFMEEHRGLGDESASEEKAFISRVRLVDDYRRFVHIDPDLPPPLLPAGWSGHAAHEMFLGLYHELAGPANRYFDRTYEPPPSAE